MIFSVPPEVRDALFAAVPAGNRSGFVVEALAAKLGVKIVRTSRKAATKKMTRRPKVAAAAVDQPVAAPPVVQPENQANQPETTEEKGGFFGGLFR